MRLWPIPSTIFFQTSSGVSGCLIESLQKPFNLFSLFVFHFWALLITTNGDHYHKAWPQIFQVQKPSFMPKSPLWCFDSCLGSQRKNLSSQTDKHILHFTPITTLACKSSWSLDRRLSKDSLCQSVPIYLDLYLANRLVTLLFFCENLLINLSLFCSPNQMIAKEYEFSRAVIEMAWIILRIDYSRLFWLLFRVFSYDYHEGKPRII